MKPIYTNEDQVSAMISRNRLEAEGINVEVKNEFSAGGATPGASVPLELWVDESDYERAMQILETPPSGEGLNEWTCPKCKEKNPGNFSTCWRCQTNA